jgi:hypothetical protein
MDLEMEDRSMGRRNRFSTEQIIHKPREAEEPIARGAAVNVLNADDLPSVHVVAAPGSSEDDLDRAQCGVAELHCMPVASTHAKDL